MRCAGSSSRLWLVTSSQTQAPSRPAMAEPDTEGPSSGPQHLHPAANGGLLIVGMDEVERAHPGQLVRTPAEDLLGRLVGREDDGVPALGHPGEARRRTVEVNAAGQRLPRVPADEHAHEDAVTSRDVEVVEVDVLAGAGRQAHHDPGRALGERRLPRPDDRFPVAGDDEVHGGATRQDTVSLDRQSGRPRHEDAVGADRGDQGPGVLLEQRAQAGEHRRVLSWLPHAIGVVTVG